MTYHLPILVLTDYILTFAFTAGCSDSDNSSSDNVSSKTSSMLDSSGKSPMPDEGMESFKKLVKTVHDHYNDIFAYWDAPFPITNAYTEGLNRLIKMSNRLGRGYSYDNIRAKTLYSAEARKVGSGIRSGRGKVEYGPHIPTLLKQVESGELD